MDILDYDPIKELTKYWITGIEPSNELPKAIKSLELFRDDNFNLAINVYSDANDKPSIADRPLGLVYTSDDSLSLKCRVGSGSVNGINLVNVNSKITTTNRDTATTSTYKIDNLKFKISDDPASYIVERIANLPQQLIWPHSFEEKQSGEYELTFGGDLPITIKHSLPGTHHLSNSCARFEFGEHTAIIGAIASEDIPKSKHPGYIFYSGSPDTETREKIRSSLSFSFGRPLVYFGSCFYKEGSELIGLEVVSPRTIDGRVWTIPPRPFAPIMTSRSNELDIEPSQKLAQSFFENYETLNLRNFIFRLWYAEVSPYYMRPAYYGSMIESIQKQETGKPGSKISHTIIPKPDYRAAIKTLTRYLQKREIPTAAKTLFQKKLENGNSAPQRIIAERFYNALGLELGDIENAAWDKRNDAAHGNELAPGSDIDQIRSTKVLRVILARIVLKLLNGSDRYIDYYTLGHPTRNLGASIPDS